MVVGPGATGAPNVAWESAEFLKSLSDRRRAGGSDSQNGGAATNGEEKPRLSIGPYVLLHKIGQGGFSEVYAAHHRLHPEYQVAVKIFRPRRFDSQQRLQLEILVLSKFKHPSLVNILDAGQAEDGASYLVMDLIEGLPLDRYLAQNPIAYGQMAGIFRDVALAVGHAHDRDVVHRDLKPTNVMVRPDGRPVVIDFGLAKRLNLEELEQSLTASYAVVGTLGYLAPEQADTKQREITRAVDIYGLGATLYFALTGRPPVAQGEFYRAIEELRRMTPTRPRRLNRAVPRDLELICLKCLEKSPTDRYSSLQAVAEDLDRFIAGRRVQARPLPWLSQQWRWCQANSTVACLLAIIFVAISSGLVTAAVLWRQADFRWRQSQVLLAQAQEILRISDQAAEEMLVQTPGALEYRHERLKQSLQFRQQLNATVSPEQGNRRSVAVNHFLLGKICVQRGLPAEAHEHYMAAMGLFQELLAQDPQNPKLRFDMFHCRLGLDHTTRQYQLTGSEKFDQLTWALEIIQGLVDDYPDDIRYRDALACGLCMLGGRLDVENPVLAIEILERAHREAKALKDALPEPCLEWRHVGTSATLLAKLSLLQQDLPAAKKWAVMSREATEAFLSRPNPDPHDVIDLSHCHLLFRAIALQEQDHATADHWEAQWRELLESSAKTYPDLTAFRVWLDQADELLTNQVAQYSPPRVPGGD
jgi:serine/threonine protein kinase/tetratricopeptide (TPR) repeat protein